MEGGMVWPVVRVTVFVLKNFPAIAYPLHRESVASTTTERIASGFSSCPRILGQNTALINKA